MKDFETSPTYQQIREELIRINARIEELKDKSLALRREIQVLFEKYEREKDAQLKKDAGNG